MPDLRGRVLQEQDATHAVGTAIEAGLPNITGETVSGSAYSYAMNQKGTGALWVSKRGQIGSGGYTGGYQNLVISIDASKSSSVYGNSSTVQPPAYSVRYLIRALP